MVLHFMKWLAFSYFTYFFSYGIFLPFWGVWLKETGLTSESIGILLGTGLVARFFGNLLITSRVRNPALLIKAIRILSILTLVFVIAFWISQKFVWLIIVMASFNFFFSPLIPLSDALANIWQRQIDIDYGRVRLWGSIAFIIGSILTGELISLFYYQVILISLTIGIVSMLVGVLIRPSIMPQKIESQQYKKNTGWLVWKILIVQHWRFLTCVCLLQGAHAAYYGFSAIHWQMSGYSASTTGYLWSLGVIAEIIIFALSKKLFRRFSFSDLLLLSAVCGIVRWSIMGWTTALPWLMLSQIFHCGTFAVCHLAAICYISSQEESDIIRLQAIYSSVAMGGSVAILTIFSGFLYQYLGQSIFWIMTLIALLSIIVRPNSRISKLI